MKNPATYSAFDKYCINCFSASLGRYITQRNTERNTFFGFIVEKRRNHSIEIKYDLTCYEEDEENCKYDEELERKIFRQLINSITFARK